MARIKPGICYVYAKVHNGLKTKVKVTVKNYARVGSYYGTYIKEDDIYILVTEYKTQMQNIAEYYSINRLKPENPIEMKLDNDAEVVISPSNADIRYLKKDIESLLVDFPYHISIKVNADFVEFDVRKQDSQDSLLGYVRFWFDNDCSNWESLQIASHWEAFRFRPI